MIGDIMELKVACLNNEAGTKGFIFYDYGDGFQVIFPNGNYDGFSNVVEAEYYLKKVGHDPSVSDYQFKNVTTVSTDYRKGYWKFK